MNQLLIDELEGKEIEALLVQSFEPDIYLAKALINDVEYQIYRAPGELLREFSQLALKKHFKRFSIKSTYLLHDSVYDEMVGGPPASSGVMKVRIANPSADYS